MKTKSSRCFLAAALLSALLAGAPRRATAAETLDSRTRTELAKMLTRMVKEEVAGGSVQIKAVNASRNRVQIYASIGLSYYPFREQNVAAMRDSVRELLPEAYRKAAVELYTDNQEIGRLIPMAFRSDSGKASKKRRERKDLPLPFTQEAVRPLVKRLSAPVEPTRGLAGRHIALWQSHGRFFDQTQNTWRWQRVRLWETCEDLYTQSYVLPYLVPMLERAGAVVMLPRERDVQQVELLADNDAPESYREQAGAAQWTEGGTGFAHRRQVYLTGENPFRHGTTRCAATTTDARQAGTAVWSARIPRRGEYAVYVSYETTPRSADDARYTVHHLGGETQFAVNQTMGGGTWIYLGTFALDAGRQDVVTLSTLSHTAGRTVSADAVKIGGGYGNIARTVREEARRAGTAYAEETSGYPRFCEGSRYWLQWAGFDEKVYSPKEHTDDYKDDYMSRAHWVNALMGGSKRLPDSAGLRIPVDMALAFHSDAGVRDGDETIGTLGIFCTSDNKGRFDGGASRYRSRDLTDIVMSQIVSDIRRTWEPEWNRRGMWNRSYYEARVPWVPTMLLELLSHQNFADMRYGSDPRFKFLVSRAVYKGVLRFLASQYEVPYVVQPLPVEAFAAELTADGRTRLHWQPVSDSLEASAVPTGYIVYTRVDDGAFDNGTPVAEPAFETTQEPGHIYSYQVTAFNDGGESFPSETLAVCRMARERGRMLLVNGFDRVSAPLSEASDSLAGFRRDLDGGVPDRRDISFVGAQRIFDRTKARVENEIEALGSCEHDFETDIVGGNTFDYPYLHGRSVAAAGYSFCSASVRAVEQGSVSLDDYPCVDLILGKQRTTTMGRGLLPARFAAFPPALQEHLRRYLAREGALFVSGAYLLSDLWGPDGEAGQEEDNATAANRSFAREVLHCTPDGCRRQREARVRVVAAQPRFSRGDYRYWDTPSADRYGVEACDALKPAGAGAAAAMRYAGDGRTACVVYAGSGRTVVLGFPFEMLTDEALRDRMMHDVLDFFHNDR